MLEQVLTQNGLSEKEARIYITILECGETTMGALATKTKLKRSTVYSVVEELQKRSIVSIIKRKGIQRISALPPQGLIERFRKATTMAENILPQLMELAYSSPLKPRLRFYEGMEGLKDIILQVNHNKKVEPGMIFTDYSQMPEEIFKLIREVVPNRKKNNNFLRIITPNNNRNKEVKAEEKELHYAEHRIADLPLNNFPLELTLFENSKIGFLSFKKNELFGVVIDSEAIYMTLKNLFLYIWKTAEIQ